MMNNAQLADVFDRIATLCELKGESIFIIRAYQRATRTIQDYPQELEQYVREGKNLTAIPGIGDAISKKIRELLATGKLEFYERLKAGFPEGLLAIMDIPGIGPSGARRLHKDLGITTIAELEQALADGRIAHLPRVGQKLAEAIHSYLQTHPTAVDGPAGKGEGTAQVVV
ncbi:MAG: hypothetical protein HY532_01335 [Chloroflexi bacterium]|nr:hypothetical protein [Chloroflexota bacterium]